MKRFNRLISTLILTISLALPASYSFAKAPVIITDATSTATTSTAAVVDNKLMGIDRDYRISILHGDIENHTEFALEGHNPNISTTDEVVWQVPSATQKLYVWNAAADTVLIVSDDDTDNASGVGAREYTITGLLAGYVADTEVVAAHATDGTIAVSSTKEWLRINSVEVTDAGSGGGNAGNIAITESTDTNILSWVEAGENISFQSVFTSADDETVYITEITGNASGNKNVHVHVNVREFGGLFKPIKHRTILDSPFEMSQIKLPPKTDIIVITHSDITGGIVDLSLEGWIETSE